MRNAKEWELLVMAVGKMVIGMILAGAVGYSVVKGVPISDEVLRWMFLIVAGCLGISAGQSGVAWFSVRRKRRGG